MAVPVRAMLDTTILLTATDEGPRRAPAGCTDRSDTRSSAAMTAAGTRSSNSSYSRQPEKLPQSSPLGS